MKSNIKAILFDSGKVLNGPVTGHWFITPNFFEFVNEKAFLSILKSQRNMAFSKAGEYIASQPLITTEEDEYKHFLEYYRILFKHLPDLRINEEQLINVTRDLVYNYEKYKFYEDALEVVPKLSKNYKLAVVSDAWPSLDNVFRNAELRDYFSAFVISSVKGINKPHELMYKTALEELEVKPEEAIFIDDSIKNCDGARKLGINSYVLSRDIRLYLYNKIMCTNHAVIRDLRDVGRVLK